jgi:Secretion system C-terminal sorting domain
MLKRSTIIRFFILFSIVSARAQENTTSAGDTAIGIGGSQSFSIGQVFYSSEITLNGEYNQGVQQPYEFVTLSNNEIEEFSLSYTLFPNPSSSVVNLLIESENSSNLSYTLFDTNGRELIHKNIHSSETPIMMDSFPSSIYFLKVSRNNVPLETFKIIKN